MRDALSTVQLCFLSVSPPEADRSHWQVHFPPGRSKAACWMGGTGRIRLLALTSVPSLPPSPISTLPSLPCPPLTLFSSPPPSHLFLLCHFSCFLVVLLPLYPTPTSLPSLSLSFSSLLISISLPLCLFLSLCICLSLSSLLSCLLLLLFSTPNSLP